MRCIRAVSAVFVILAACSVDTDPGQPVDEVGAAQEGHFCPEARTRVESTVRTLAWLIWYGRFVAVPDWESGSESVLQWMADNITNPRLQPLKDRLASMFGPEAWQALEARLSEHPLPTVRLSDSFGNPEEPVWTVTYGEDGRVFRVSYAFFYDGGGWVHLRPVTVEYLQPSEEEFTQCQFCDASLHEPNEARSTSIDLTDSNRLEYAGQAMTTFAGPGDADVFHQFVDNVSIANVSMPTRVQVAVEEIARRWVKGLTVEWLCDQGTASFSDSIFGTETLEPRVSLAKDATELELQTPYLRCSDADQNPLPIKGRVFVTVQASDDLPVSCMPYEVLVGW